jgi:hypothetical protein
VSLQLLAKVLVAPFERLGVLDRLATEPRGVRGHNGEYHAGKHVNLGINHLSSIYDYDWFISMIGYLIGSLFGYVNWLSLFIAPR